MCTCQDMYVEFRRQLAGGNSLYSVGSGDQTQAVRLEGKHLSLWSHLASAEGTFFFFFSIIWKLFFL